ncbi:hypothetical protein KAR91_87335 [Candidatus Pacearchaeota archaeon]|nr:hypothetical protein [Candidatus Pacearchaeota archaeon]
MDITQPHHNKVVIPTISIGPVKKVWSLSIGDVHASTILPKLKGFPDIVTGSGLGGVFAILIAAGFEPNKILEIYKQEGYQIGKGNKKITHKQISYFIAHRDLLGRESVKMQIKDLKYDVFFEVLNASKGIPSIISKQTSPDMLVKIACLLCVSHPVFCEKTKIGKSQSIKSGGLSENGVFWGSYASYPIPDPVLLDHYGKGLQFETFYMPHEQYIPKEKKVNKRSGYQIDQTYSASAVRAIKEMSDRLGSNYRLTIMKPAPFVMNLPKKEIGKLIEIAKGSNDNLIAGTS